MEKKSEHAALIVSFGTSMEDVIDRCIVPVENDISMATGRDAYRAFTSRMIVKKLRKNGFPIDFPFEALSKLSEMGYESVVVQPTHILPGLEYNELLVDITQFSCMRCDIPLAIGQPLFFKNSDYDLVVDALREDFPEPDEATIFFGHGSEHLSNSCYFAFAHYLSKACDRAFVANVEGDPILEEVIERLKQKGIKKTRLVPLMLVAGDHARNDMAGDEENSWKSILTSQGFEVKCCLKGMGENQKIRDIYAQKALAAHESLLS